MDTEVVSAQTALSAAQTNLSNAQARYNDAAAKYDATPPDDIAIKETSAIFQRASAALQAAEQEYASSARQLSTAHGNAATRAGTPEGRAAYAAQARYYDEEAKLRTAEAGVLGAKSQAELTTAQANLANAQQSAAKTAAEIKTVMPAQANSLNASADQSRAQASEAAARTSSLIPAQAAQASATAAHTAAETTQLIPAQVKQALASAGLNDAQAADLWAKIKQPQQVTQGLDQPTIVNRDPKTGAVTGQPNPNYQAASARLLQNQQDSIAQIQSMMEKGQMSPTEANAYMDSIRAQTDAALRGTTPFQEAQQRQNYTRDAGGIGRDILNNRVSSGATLANALISGIGNAADKINVPFDFKGIDPFAMAKGYVNDMGGGQVVGDTASKLVQALLSAVQQGGGQQQLAPDGLPLETPPGHPGVLARLQAQQSQVQPAMAAAGPDNTPQTFGATGRYG